MPNLIPLRGVGTFVPLLTTLSGAYALFQVLECAFKDHAGAWETRFGIDLDSIKELPSHLQSYTEWSACPTSPKKSLYDLEDDNMKAVGVWVY